MNNCISLVCYYFCSQNITFFVSRRIKAIYDMQSKWNIYLNEEYVNKHIFMSDAFYIHNSVNFGSRSWKKLFYVCNEFYSLNATFL